MKILVTGGTGFTGQALVRRLLDLGHKVVALDCKEGLKTEEIRRWGAEIVLGSVTDADVVERAMRGVEVVHHLAAAFRDVNVPESHYWQVNVEGTRIVLEAAQRNGVRRLIHCSTCGVHGNIDFPPAGEDSPIRPADYYQRTKYEAEPVVEEFFRKGLKTVILRPAAIYGPGDPERFVMIFRRVATGRFPMFGNGKTYYHPLYIDNLVDAFLLAMEDGRGDGAAYLIADEEYLEIEDLVRRVGQAMNINVRITHYPILPLIVAGHVCEKLCKPFGMKPPIFPRRVDWFRQNRAFRIDRATTDLGYRPRIGIEEGLKRTADWYRQEGYI
ncbi:MAG: NAD-dependent epimerase/dehydratase family protein [Acidobacteriota bacterium]